jgi:energy-coupling factor transporter ATP-binding protein EcfA2
LNNQFGSDWDVYAQNLFRTAIAKEIAVIALTDYFTIDGYRKIKEEYLAKPAKLAELFTPGEIDAIQRIRVLPNIEFRLNKLIGPNRVNAHVIFSDEVSIRDIEENFLHDLEFTYEAEPQSTALKRKLKVENLRELGEKLIAEHAKFKDLGDGIYVGMMNAVMDDDKVIECLADKRFRDKFLFCVVSDEDLPRLAWDAQDHLTRKVLLQRSDALFSGNPKTRSWALARSPYADGEDHFIKEFMSLKPCLHGSDSHAFHEIGHPCAMRGKKGHVCDPSKPEGCELRYCWIKADTTFEGLRQVLHEPADRVFIGPTAPDYHDQARVISSVTLSDSQGWFAEVEIPLNGGMVSIIGQKGSGKSALADLIAYAAGSWIQDDDKCFLYRASPHVDGLKVALNWADGSTTTEVVGEDNMPLDLVRYLSQDYVERICARDGITRELVREIEQVIFNYLDPVDRLNASDFAELRATKTAGVTAESDRLRGVVSTIIRDEFALRELIAKLPEKEARLKTLDSEREGLKKQMPLPASPEEAKLLKELQLKRDALTKAQRDAAAEKQRLQRVDDLHRRVDAFRAQIDRFYEELQPSLREAGILDSDWPAFKPVFSQDYRVPIGRRSREIQASLAAIEGGEPPAPNTIKKLVAEIDELSKRESADKARQERTKQIQMRIAAINAEFERLEAEIKNINEVDKPRLKGVQTRRLNAYYDYFSNLVVEQQVLQSLYEPVRESLNEQALLEGKDLEFAIRWTADLKAWLERGEALFDQRRTGPYGTYEKLSEAARKTLLPAWTSGEAQKIKDALDKFLEPFRNTELQPAAYLRANVKAIDLMTWLFEVDHIRLDYGLKFNGADLESLSPGTKGIVLLILYLGMDVNDTRPLIVDQPDENLDNESIYNLLTPYFRLAKVRRQVIVITHNPNLVVNSDSDQVIIASAEKRENGLPVIHYVSGALEDKAIRQQVCNILEGGKDAFLKRDRRYAIERRA